MKYHLTEGQLNGPTEVSVVDGLSKHLKLPDSYIEFLKKHDSGEGFIGDNYIILWKAEELVDFNRQYEVETYAPGIFLFASNGGGEGYGFDTLDVAMPVVRIPFIGMDRQDAISVASDLPDLFTRLADLNDSNKPLRPKGMELFEIKPAIVGGDPISPENKIWLTRKQHFEAVRYWNRIISTLRNKPK